MPLRDNNKAWITLERPGMFEVAANLLAQLTRGASMQSTKRLFLTCLATYATAIACAKSERETPASQQSTTTTSAGGSTSTQSVSTVSTTTTTGSGGSAGEASTSSTTATISSATSGGSGGAPVVEDPCAMNGGAAGAAGNAGAGGIPGSGDQVFFEDFENSAERWENSDGTTWSITTDAETGSSVYGNSEVINEPRIASVTNACFTDVIVEAKVKVLDFPGSSTTYFAGPCLRVESSDDYYVLGIQGNGNVGLIRVSGGSRSSLQSDGSAIPDGEEDDVWYTLRLEAVGAALRAYVNGSLVIDDTDSTHTFGSIGVCTSNADAVFDDISVTLP